MVTQHQKVLPSSEQPSLNKEDEQSSILRSMELHYYQLSMKRRPLKEIFRGAFILRKSVTVGHGGNSHRVPQDLTCHQCR